MSKLFDELVRRINAAQSGEELDRAVSEEEHKQLSEREREQLGERLHDRAMILTNASRNSYSETASGEAQESPQNGGPCETPTPPRFRGPLGALKARTPNRV